jgi:hypothetical protein
MGWPRAPRDGFIRGGGLACGNIKHRGIKAATEELRLVLGASGTPIWIVEGKHASPNTRGEDACELHEVNVNKHVALLLNDSRRIP